MYREEWEVGRNQDRGRTKSWSRSWEKRVLLRVCRPQLLEVGGLRRKDWECFSAA